MKDRATTIIVDGTGGDYAPREIVKGVIESAQLFPALRFIVTGPVKMITEEFAVHGGVGGIKIVDAPEVIEMGEEPGRAVKTKQNSSIVVGMRLIKEGRADAFVSAGNTGATMAASLLIIGRIAGVKRPAIGVILPSATGSFLILDAGANADNKPEYLPQFAVMGSTYAKDALGITNPKVGLLNLGEEAEKGSLFTKEAFQLIRETPVNFIGNVEGNTVFEGQVDVLVTDGFTGNVFLKVVEGVAATFLGALKEGIIGSVRGKAGGFLLTPAITEMIKKNDPEETGGAVLLGIDGVCIIGHGRSNAKAIRNAVRVAAASVENDIVGHIRQGIARD